MKCLTLKQPWAGLILTGPKDVENRRWATPHRGELLIHAGRSIDTRAWTLRQVQAHADRALCADLGAILGVVELYDVIEGAQCQLPWADGSTWAWLLRRPRLFRRPIVYGGALGLFDVPDAQVRPALANALPPRAWRNWRDQQRHQDAAPMHQASLDGWTGD